MGTKSNGRVRGDEGIFKVSMDSVGSHQARIIPLIAYKGSWLIC